MITKRLVLPLFVAFAAFLLTSRTVHSNPTQAKRASVHGGIDGREIGGSAGLLQSSRSAIASQITPIAPELERSPTSATKVGRVSQSSVNETTVQVGDNPQKRHVSVNDHGHHTLPHQNVNDNRQRHITTFHPSQSNNQNGGATIVSLKPSPISTHNSAFSYDHNNVNSNQQIHVFNTHSDTGSNINRHVSSPSQNTNNIGFNNAVHQSNALRHASINKGVLQSVSNDAGILIDPDVLPTSINNNNNSPVYHTSISKGVLQSSSIVDSQTKDRDASQNGNEVEHHKVNVIQGGSVVQHQNKLHESSQKIPENNRANLAQRLSSVLAFKGDQDNGNKENNVQATASNSQRGDARSRQIGSQNSVASSSVVSSGPCVAAFSVRKGLAAATDETKPRRLTFLDVLVNTGGWSQSRNQFEVPCAGLYYFSFNAISTKTSDFTIGLMKDGRYQVTAYGGKDSYQWGGNSVVLFLTPGEKVYLELQEGELYEHPYEEAYTTFSGFLINSL